MYSEKQRKETTMNTCAKCRFYSTFLCYCHRHHDYTGNDDYCGSYESEREAMRHCELQYGCV